MSENSDYLKSMMEMARKRLPSWLFNDLQKFARAKTGGLSKGKAYKEAVLAQFDSEILSDLSDEDLMQCWDKFRKLYTTEIDSYDALQVMNAGTNLIDEITDRGFELDISDDVYMALEKQAGDITHKDAFIPNAMMSETCKAALASVESQGLGSRLDKIRATQIIDKKPISLDAVKRMKAYFDKSEGKETTTKWELYGGLPAKTWCEEIMQSMKVEKADADWIEKSGGGVMVALKVPGHIAKELEMAGGENPDDMHVTVAYMGKLDKLGPESIEKIRKTVKEICADYPPLVGKVGGVGRFSASESSDGKDVYYASFNSPQLTELRQKMVDALDTAGVPVNKKHGYTPHITIKYVEPSEVLDLTRLESDEMEFPGIGLYIGGEMEEIPFGVEDITKEGDEGIALTPDLEMALAMMGLTVVEKEGVSEIQVPILKAEPMKKQVFGVVLQPDVVDQQGDIMTAAEIEETAHKFLKSSRVIGLGHSKVAQAELIESCIVRADGYKVNGQNVKKGSWMIGVQVLDDVTWSEIQGSKIQSFSVGGFGLREPVS